MTIPGAPCGWWRAFSVAARSAKALSLSLRLSAQGRELTSAIARGVCARTYVLLYCVVVVIIDHCTAADDTVADIVMHIGSGSCVLQLILQAASRANRRVTFAAIVVLFAEGPAGAAVGAVSAVVWRVTKPPSVQQVLERTHCSAQLVQRQHCTDTATTSTATTSTATASATVAVQLVVIHCDESVAQQQRQQCNGCQLRRVTCCLNVSQRGPKGCLLTPFFYTTTAAVSSLCNDCSDAQWIASILPPCPPPQQHTLLIAMHHVRTVAQLVFAMTRQLRVAAFAVTLAGAFGDALLPLSKS
eukprot:4301-Heterococcus_DN1.PRE.4